MVLTIGPAGSGTPQRHLLSSHLAGLLIGALVSALVLTVIGSAADAEIRGWEQIVLGATALCAALWLPRTVGVKWGVPWPSRTWQVPQQWRHTLPMPATVGGYGTLLGMGVLTTPVLPALWCLVALTVGAGSVVVAAAGWVTYALARFAMAARKSVEVAATGEIPDDVHGSRGFRVMRVANTGLLVLIVVAAVLELTS